MELTSDQVRAFTPLAVTLDITYDLLTAAEVRSALTWREELTTAGGSLHGGALMSLADTSGAVCAVLNLPPGATTSTVESTTHFMRAVRSGVVRSVSRPLHVGRSTIVVETDLLDDQDRRVARTTQVQAVLQPPTIPA